MIWSILDTSLSETDEKESSMAKLACIDEILEYEQEIAHLEKVIKSMNVTWPNI